MSLSDLRVLAKQQCNNRPYLTYLKSCNNSLPPAIKCEPCDKRINFKDAGHLSSQLKQHCDKPSTKHEKLLALWKPGSKKQQSLSDCVNSGKTSIERKKYFNKRLAQVWTKNNIPLNK